MNVYDSERMAEVLGADGFAETQAMEDADLVILNTCHIREKAAEKVYSDLGRIRQVKDAARSSAGKDDDRRGRRLRGPGRGRGDRAPRAGRRPRGRAAELSPAGRARRPRQLGGARLVETDFPEEDKFAHLPERRRPAPSPRS